MDKGELGKRFSEFLNPESYDSQKMNAIWEEQSSKFRSFWVNKICDNRYTELLEDDLDPIVKILDKKGKGSTKNDIAVANAMIPQGVWYRIFNSIKASNEMKDVLTALFESQSADDQIVLIDRIYKLNEGKKNYFTGPSANALNALLFAYNPSKYLSVISLNHRKKIIESLNFKDAPDFRSDSPGKKIVASNQSIINGFKELGIIESPRVISDFLYSKIGNPWNPNKDDQIISQSETSEIDVSEEEGCQSAYEDELENFLIANWEKTELNERYDLYPGDGEKTSQQFPTDIGKIDILAIDRKTQEYVVIELKRNQTSDVTVGQILRYMGWIEHNLKKPVKGIIICRSFDKRIWYALRKIPNIQTLIYKLEISFSEAKEKLD